MCLKAVRLVVMLALVLLTAPRIANAQPSTKVHRIGWLSAGSPPSGSVPSFEAFKQSLRDLGYIEGQNLTIEYRYAEGNGERLPDLAAELVRLHVDIIFTESSTPAAHAAKQATSMSPIIMAGVGADPVKSGLVTSLARPEGNVTGVTASGIELWEQRLELLREAVPSLSRLAVLWNPANPGNALGLREIKAVALAMGVQLQPLEIRDANAFERAFAAIVQEPPDALIICLDTLTSAHAKRIADFAVRSRLPTMTPMRNYVQAGALMSVGASLPVLYRRAAYYVDKILKGTKPADLPVERAMQFELVINLQTAQALGLTLPPILLFQAHEVIR